VIKFQIPRKYFSEEEQRELYRSAAILREPIEILFKLKFKRKEDHLP